MAFKMKSKNDIEDPVIVEGRLRHFINKYYGVKILQGLVLTIITGVVILICMVILGNAVQVDKHSYQWIVAGSSLIIAFVSIVYIVRPLAQLMGYVKGLNFKEASRIIQKKHLSIEDRIINIVELAREKIGKSNNLYDYAIEQKTIKIEKYNFEDAISFRKLGLFILRLILLCIFSAGILLLWPEFVKKGIGSVWSGSSEITGVRRVEFVILNDSLEVEAGKDFLLRFQVLSQFPVENVSVLIGTAMSKVDLVAGDYNYMFNSVNSPVSFRISAGTTESEEYVLQILKRPEVGSLQLKIVPPSYTGLSSVIIEGDGNAEVPSGSKVSWSIRTVNTDELFIVFGSDTVDLVRKGNLWNYENIISKNTYYEILCKNLNGLFINYFYKIAIVKDQYPAIDIYDSRDSAVSGEVYIQGIIQDDYGFSKLEAISVKQGSESAKEIKISQLNIYEEFYYTIAPDSNSTSFFFRIWDNDRISGEKYTDSRKITIKTFSREEIEKLNSQLADSIESGMLEGMNAVEKMEKEISEFKMELILGNLKPWEIQEKLKGLNELKMDVLDLLNNISKTDKEYTDNEELLNLDESITEKARQIQELMENLLDDEMRELLKQFEELAKEFNSKTADELADKMEMNLEKLKEQMEMSIELLKKYELEKDLMKQVDKLDQMADSLQKEKPGNDSLGNELKEEFRNWEQKYDTILQQDQVMKKPMGLDNLEKEREEVRQALEEFKKCDRGGSCADEKERASKGLRKLSKKIADKLGIMNGEAQFVDLEDIRQIRNSLNDYSKRQEELNSRIQKINNVNPTFTSVIKGQKELEDKFLSIRDSLKSIGYKQPLIARIIGAELFHVETSLKNLFKSYADNRMNVVRVEQNRIMSEINMIAVKLDELITSMQNAKGSGEGNKGFKDRKKKKDGDQKESDKLGETKSKQESLKEQLKSSIQKMKSGATGKKERGELARMLGEREMMRKTLEKVLQDGGLGKEGKEKANEALNMMKEVEKDIIYNRLGDHTIEKDKIIKTKLLDAENAEKERETENRRESKEFKGSFEPNRNDMEKVGKQDKALDQVLKYKELKLKRFYQERYLKYIESTKR